MDVVIYGIPKGNLYIDWDDQVNVKNYFDKYADMKLCFSVSPEDSTSKKKKMYDFYHKAILDAAMIAFSDMGWQSMDKYKADILLKNECAKDVIVNDDTGEEIVFTLEKRSMNKERLHKFLSDCITFLEIDCGVIVVSGSEWRLSK